MQKLMLLLLTVFPLSILAAEPAPYGLTNPRLPLPPGRTPGSPKRWCSCSTSIRPTRTAITSS